MDDNYDHREGFIKKKQFAIESTTSFQDQVLNAIQFNKFCSVFCIVLYFVLDSYKKSLKSSECADSNQQLCVLYLVGLSVLVFAHLLHTAGLCNRFKNSPVNFKIKKGLAVD